MVSATAAADADRRGSHGHSQWFIELVEDLGHMMWIGDAAQIRASYVRKRRTTGATPIIF